MKTLLLLRHAKSDRSPSLGDAERPLNERGRNAVPRIGAAMAERGFLPDLALVSPAKRTRETWALIAPEIKAKTPAEFLPQLYLAAASRLLETICRSWAAMPRACSSWDTIRAWKIWPRGLLPKSSCPQEARRWHGSRPNFRLVGSRRSHSRSKTGRSCAPALELSLRLLHQAPSKIRISPPSACHYYLGLWGNAA